MVRITSMIVLLAALWGSAGAGRFTPVDNALQGWRFTTSSRPVSGDMVFVEIDAASLQSVGVWPWPRTVHATLLDRLVELGALDIVFDVDFSAASTTQGDGAFAAALRRAGGYAYLAAFQQMLSNGQTVLSRPLPLFEAEAQAVLVNVDGDGTALLESVPAALSAIPSVAYTLAPETGAPPPSILIDYSIDLTGLQRISVIDVLNGSVDPALLADKQVVIGASAIELRDYFRVPRFGVIEGGMVQIAATETLKARRALTDMGFVPASLLGLIAVVALLLTRQRFSVPQRAIAALFASVAVELGALLVLNQSAMVADTALYHAMVGGAVALCFLDERARRWQQSKHQQAQLAFLARHDAPTGAMSRHALVEAVTAGPAGGALVVVQLQRLDAVNASLGHEIFDQVAREIVARLTRLNHGLPARLDSDIFAFAVQQQRQADSTLVSSVEQARVVLERPYEIAGHTVLLSAVFGSASRTDCTGTADSVLQEAEIALAVAQASQVAAVVYQPAHGQQIRDRRLLDLALRRALQRDEFHLLYQPQIDLRSGEMVGVEALIRWRNPELGLVSPADFIPLAEETGLIVEIGDWVLREACRQIARWRWQGKLSVNVSAVQFAQGNLVASVQQALQSSGLAPQRLGLELTESANMVAAPRNLDIMRQLSDLGIALAMDDFGTGFSSLGYLTSLPISTIKIDQSFVRSLPSANSAVIIETTLAMAHRLGKTVVAEGVETEQQRAYLQAAGCDIGQGYLFGRPSRLADLELRQISAA
jgi:EAL domain-containing protein (putative c-di-GMP-specific phosphodiesterase class I)/CHASE2 domain-containing sensor protein/GGDEF domain-containing protein